LRRDIVQCWTSSAHWRVPPGDASGPATTYASLYHNEWCINHKYSRTLYCKFRFKTHFIPKSWHFV